MPEHHYSSSDIILWSLLLIGLIVAGWLTVWQVKRRLQKTDDLLGNAGFTLSDLRRLHKSGQMSDEEFEKAKARVVEAARRAAARDDAQAGGLARARPTAVEPLPDRTPRPRPPGQLDDPGEPSSQ
jgi:hypothetical protein